MTVIRDSEFAIVFRVPMLSVTNGKPQPEAHNAERGNQHDQDGSVDRSLALLRSGLGGCAAHGAALGERWGGPQGQREERQQLLLSQPHLTP